MPRAKKVTSCLNCLVNIPGRFQYSNAGRTHERYSRYITLLRCQWKGRSSKLWRAQWFLRGRGLRALYCFCSAELLMTNLSLGARESQLHWQRDKITKRQDKPALATERNIVNTVWNCIPTKTTLKEMKNFKNKQTNKPFKRELGTTWVNTEMYVFFKAH